MSLEKKKPMRLRKNSLRVLNQIETGLVGGGTNSTDPSWDFSCNKTFETVSNPGGYTFNTTAGTDGCPINSDACPQETEIVWGCHPPSGGCSHSIFAGTGCINTEACPVSGEF